MSELISGKEALIAFLDGKEVEFKDVTNTWHKAHSGLTLDVVSRYQFRLKPRTITINIESPKPRNIEWDSERANKVEIEFHSPRDANEFYRIIVEAYSKKNPH